jgi:tRNA A37 threonylcarbamoyladenosine dehydratase
MKNLGQDSRCPARDTNRTPPAHKSEPTQVKVNDISKVAMDALENYVCSKLLDSIIPVLVQFKYFPRSRRNTRNIAEDSPPLEQNSNRGPARYDVMTIITRSLVCISI